MKSKLKDLYDNSRNKEYSWDERQRFASEYWHACQAVAKQLPFTWYGQSWRIGPTIKDQPGRRNRTGYGRAHIVVDESVVFGRLRRNAGDTLCKSSDAVGADTNSEYPSCKDCMVIAERIVSASQIDT